MCADIQRYAIALLQFIIIVLSKATHLSNSISSFAMCSQSQTMYGDCLARNMRKPYCPSFAPERGIVRRSKNKFTVSLLIYVSRSSSAISQDSISHPRGKPLPSVIHPSECRNRPCQPQLPSTLLALYNSADHMSSLLQINHLSELLPLSVQLPK